METFVAFQHTVTYPWCSFISFINNPTQGMEGVSGVKELAVQAKRPESGSSEPHHAGWVWKPASNSSLRRQRYEEVLGTS